jgi:hypothetical protein
MTGETCHTEGVNMDTAKILADLPGLALTAEVMKVLEVYEAVMKVYAASEVRYQAAIQAAAPINGFAASTSAR